MNLIKCSLPKELNVFYKYELNVSLKEMWITCIQDLWELQEIIVTKEENGSSSSVLALLFVKFSEILQAS